MSVDNELLHNVYRYDSVFSKINAIYEKWKNHHNRKDMILVGSRRDIYLLRLKKDFTSYPNILINQLTEVNFACKDCFKIFLILYKYMLRRNTMRTKCKKEYLRKMCKVNRQTLDRALKELQEKNMLFIEKPNAYFYFTLNLCFNEWSLSESEMEIIKENNESELRKWDNKYLDEENIFNSD